jgi:uncharacterized protein YciU (UPF0263 family)
MKIAICTKQRPERQKTLEMLYKIFSKEDIYLFVEPNELKDYQKYEKVATIGVLGENNKGIRYARSFVLDYFKSHFPTEILCMADDDMDSFSIRTEKVKYWRMRKATQGDIVQMFAFNEMFLRGHEEYGQSTISFGGSNFLFDGEQKENTRCWAFMFFNIANLNKYNINYDVANGFELFEDYDITIEMLQKGLKNISFYKWAFNTKFANKGGVEMFRFNKEKNDRSVEYMVRKYPEIVTSFFSKAHNLAEVKVNWKKAYNGI